MTEAVKAVEAMLQKIFRYGKSKRKKAKKPRRGIK
jgi:hypothetical protein